MNSRLRKHNLPETWSRARAARCLLGGGCLLSREGIALGGVSVEVESLASFLRDHGWLAICGGSLLRGFLCDRRFALISESLAEEGNVFPGSLDLDIAARDEVAVIEVIEVHIALEQLADYSSVHREEVTIQIQKIILDDVCHIVSEKVNDRALEPKLLSFGVIIIREREIGVKLELEVLLAGDLTLHEACELRRERPDQQTENPHNELTTFNGIALMLQKYLPRVGEEYPAEVPQMLYLIRGDLLLPV